MQFYFGKANTDEFGEEDLAECFKHGSNYYFYRLEANEDGFVLHDTCGRYVPLDPDSVDEFATAGFVAKQFFSAHNEANDLLTKRLDQLNQLVEFWEKNP